MNSNTPTILKRIMAKKHEEVASAKAHVSEAQLLEQIKHAQQGTLKPRGFAKAMFHTLGQGRSAVIAEAKQASPSKGVIRANYDPALIAKSYQQGGATCMSILTDSAFFKGSSTHLKMAREACNLPVLRKDFMLDDYQIYEARAMGADCILLIVACLDDDKMHHLANLAQTLGMDVLVESHNVQELERALQLDTPLIGINNRDLHTFNLSLDTTYSLLQYIPDDRLVITESGIHTQADVATMQRHKINCFLVGESFMRSDDPGHKLAQLFAL